MVGQDQYPALGEVRETAKLLPRGESPWWRDEGRHLLILCLFSIRGMRLAHMHNAKSREHAHTCRKARAIFKLRYKNKKKQNKTRSVEQYGCRMSETYSLMEMTNSLWNALNKKLNSIDNKTIAIDNLRFINKKSEFKNLS